MESPASAPWVDRRLFVGLVFVIGVQGLVWLTAGVMWFGAGGTTQDYFVTIAFGIVLSIPFLVGAFVIGLGPGVALWIGMMAIFKRVHLSERQSALLAAPAVAFALCAVCLFAATYSVKENPQINRDFLISALAFSVPAAVAAEIYAYWAWPKIAKHGEYGA